MDAVEIAYNQALDYLYSFVDYSLKKASEMARASFNLERMAALLELLGNPHQQVPTLHVAGTKGKGSTSALIASALTAAGYKTGLYTSPHLQNFAERIQVNGLPIPHHQLAQLVQEIRPSVAQIPELTTFELTTALAFLHFARQKATAAVIEVGLGGRLDATNVITPSVSVITSLSYDHMTVLGNTLTQIATEKAGIIKPGIPVISAPQVPEALTVLQEIARQRQAPFLLVGKDLTSQPGRHSLKGQSFTLTLPAAWLPGKKLPGGQKSVILRIPLLGQHQVENAATAFAALQLSGLIVPLPAIKAGFANVYWPCRFEIASRAPTVIFDSAHNPDSFVRLRLTLDEYFPGQAVILILGASEDKNLAAMLTEMAPKVRLLIATRANHPRALAPEQIIAIAGPLGIPTEESTSVPSALARALQLAGKNAAIVLSAGSMFVTAEVKTAWQNQAK